MLSDIALAATLTALFAGITGAWSPCGFSMVETIGTALGDARRSATLIACTTFTVGALAGGALTFGGLALLGRLLLDGGGGAREALGAGLALLAAVADWRGLKIAPQIRRQVPERWRWTMRLPVACGLYGFLLGLGFTTFVLAFAVWALAAISFVAVTPAEGALIGAAFGAGRALPVLWMAPALPGGRGARALDGMAAEPRLLLGLRRLDALGLLLCALSLSSAAAAAAVIRGATDPSAAGGQIAWQQLDGPGMLRLQSGRTTALPGTYPALGQSSLAWQAGGQITVADRSSLAVKVTIPAASANALAVSDKWVVYRGPDGTGAERLTAVALSAPASQRTIAGPLPPGEIGRPALADSTLVVALATPLRSEIALLNLATGARSVLRSSSRTALLNPSLLNGRLLYERVGRCRQELRIGPQASPRRDRTVTRLRSTARRDPGYQPGYEHAYNSASLCHNHGIGPARGARMGPTALSGAAIYLTEIRPDLAADLVILRR